MSARYYVYDDCETFLNAVAAVQAAGLKNFQTFTPGPVDRLDEVLGTKPEQRIYARVALIAGLTGIATAFGMQYYASVVDVPLNVGGRPLNSWPAFMPITFILMILFAALALVGTLFWRLRLPWPAHPVFQLESFDLSREQYGILIYDTPDAELHQHLKGARIEDVR